MRPDVLGVVFLTSAVVSFNGALWQISRRKGKKDLLESHKNLSKEPLKELPGDDLSAFRPSDVEFRRVELTGSFDNEGTMLVGPRNLPSYRGPSNPDEHKSGFIAMTPFEIAGTGKFIIVNRGWVPIDAGKHRRMLAQYIGEGFATATLKGVFRKEEFMTSMWGESPDNHGPMVADLSWLVMRPYDMARHYYGRRWGPDTVEQMESKHGAQHYQVEMLEDFAGDDQRIVRGRAWPRRKDEDEITYVHLTPTVHSMYIGFWFFVTIGSLYGLALCLKRQKMILADRRALTKMTEATIKRRQDEAQAFQSAMDDATRLEAAEKAARMAKP